NSTGVFGQVESYDIARRSWSREPSLRTPRHGIAAAAVRRSLYTLGGAPRPGHASATGTAEVLELVPRTRRAPTAWRTLPPLPTPRQNMGATVLDGTIWVVGGLAPGSKGSRKVEGYDPVINEWKAGPDLPARLHHEMVVTYKGELVVIGGWIPKGSDPSAIESDR